MRIVLLICLLLLSVSPAGASTYEQALSHLENKRFTEAIPLLLPLAYAGNARAQSDLAYIYYHGYGLDRRDRCYAAIWADKAARKGDPKAMTLLGAIYSIGAGVRMNKELALLWVRAGAKAGDAAAISLQDGMAYVLDAQERKVMLEKSENFEPSKQLPAEIFMPPAGFSLPDLPEPYVRQFYYCD